uniref:SH2 domain containing adaptor protein B n=1 Tax=Callorhinchus milii TaxID=7868 RepID=A0A4W3HFW2_CALMI
MCVAIRDDYADPFDVQNELKNKTTKKQEFENNGYMEPYEAQKMMAEIHRQESQKKGIQLYDTPYEPEVNGVDSDTESVTNHPLRESRLPQNDDRPAEEYDQPWEWNKVTVPNFAAQFNGIEKKQSSSPLCDRRRHLRPPALIKHGSPEFCGILGERVDPTAPLEKQQMIPAFSNKYKYNLRLDSFMHMKLTKAKDKYILGQNSPPFDSVPEVIHFYTTRKLPIKGAEHLSLLYPVIVRTL